MRSHISAEDEGAGGEGGEKYAEIRDKFRKAAGRTILPIFVVRDGGGWRPVVYEMDIAPHIAWDEVDLKPVKTLKLSVYEEKDLEHVVTRSEDAREVIRQKSVVQLKEGGIHVDPVFMTRQICDIVPNPWRAHEFANSILEHYRDRKKSDERLIANNFVFLIEELRKQVEKEKERLAESIFRAMLEKDELRFLVIGKDFDWTFPKKIAVRPKYLNRKDGSQLELSLFEAVSEDEFNETEKAVAWYLESQERLFFWFRNRSRRDYSIQGWREHRIYPDFIFTATERDEKKDYERVYVVETKGLHIKDSEKTNYIRKVFDICTKQAESRNWTELGLQMKDKALQFEVLDESEWQAKLNEILQEA
ncbi:MAG: hypothetical protein V2A66_08820 [Pseudomonadota bacterium]